MTSSDLVALRHLRIARAMSQPLRHRDVRDQVCVAPGAVGERDARQLRCGAGHA
jgi:hypothetical protein